MNRDFIYNFDYQPADKVGKLLRGEKILLPHGFSIAGASAPVAPAVPTPLLSIFIKVAEILYFRLGPVDGQAKRVCFYFHNFKCLEKHRQHLSLRHHLSRASILLDKVFFDNFLFRQRMADKTGNLRVFIYSVYAMFCGWHNT